MKIALLASPLLLICSLSAQAGDRLEPGLWAAGTSMKGMQMGDMVAQCITPETAKVANGTQAEIREAIDAENVKNGCKTDTVTVAGARVTFTATCQGSPMTSDITYSGSSYKGTISVASTMGTRVLNVQATRKGPCSQ